MLRLLLDEHVSKKVAIQAKKRCPGIEVLSIHDWESGRFLATDDSEILGEAARQGLTLVTYDQKTMLTHMSALVSEVVEHGGMVDELTIPQHDIGGLVKAISWLWKMESTSDWRNRTVYLRRAPNL